MNRKGDVERWMVWLLILLILMILIIALVYSGGLNIIKEYVNLNIEYGSR